MWDKWGEGDTQREVTQHVYSMFKLMNCFLFSIPLYLSCSLLSCPCSQPQAWTNRKHSVLSAHSLCVLMSVRLKTEREQTLPSTPWSHCKHTYRSTRTWKRGRQTDRAREDSWPQSRKLEAREEVRSFSPPGGTHRTTVVYNLRISGPWLIAGSNQFGPNPCRPVQANVG